MVQFHHTNQYHNRNEIWHIGNSLNNFSESPIHTIIQHQSQNYRKRKRCQQRITGKNHGIADDLLCHIGTEKFLKMLQPYKITSYNAFHRAVILKSHQYTIHGNIQKDGCIKDCRKKQKVEIVVTFHIGLKRLFLHRCRNSLFFLFHRSPPFLS